MHFLSMKEMKRASDGANRMVLQIALVLIADYVVEVLNLPITGLLMNKTKPGLLQIPVTLSSVVRFIMGNLVLIHNWNRFAVILK